MANVKVFRFVGQRSRSQGQKFWNEPRGLITRINVLIVPQLWQMLKFSVSVFIYTCTCLYVTVVYFNLGHISMEL